jgi:hypothetical protein
MSDVRLYFDQIVVINLELYATHYINISLNNLIAPLFVLNPWVVNLAPWPIVTKAFSFVVSGGIVGALIFLTLRYEPAGSPFNWGLFYTYATASTILSPISWEHNLLIGLPGFVLFFPRFKRWEQRVFAMIILFLGLPLLSLWAPIIDFYRPAKVGTVGFVLTRLHTIAVLLILYLFSRNLWPPFEMRHDFGDSNQGA